MDCHAIVVVVVVVVVVVAVVGGGRMPDYVGCDICKLKTKISDNYGLLS